MTMYNLVLDLAALDPSGCLLASFLSYSPLVVGCMMVTDHILTSLFLISRIIVLSKPEFGNFGTITLKSSSLPVRFYNVRYWPVERSGVVRLKGTGLKHLTQ